MIRGWSRPLLVPAQTTRALRWLVRPQKTKQLMKSLFCVWSLRRKIDVPRGVFFVRISYERGQKEGLLTRIAPFSSVYLLSLRLFAHCAQRDFIVMSWGIKADGSVQRPHDKQPPLIDNHLVNASLSILFVYFIHCVALSVYLSLQSVFLSFFIGFDLVFCFCNVI